MRQLGMAIAAILLTGGEGSIAKDGIIWEDLSVSKGKKILVAPQGGSVGSGRLTAIIGPSGAGKTTFLRGLVSATRGLEAQGTIWQMPTGFKVLGLEKGDCGFLAQDAEMFGMMTVFESLYFAYAMRNSQKAQEATQAALEAFGLEKIANRRVGDARSAATNSGSAAISGGERRRLCVAIELALCGSESPPKILTADEPVSGLDVVAAEVTIRHLRNYAQKYNIAAVATLHGPASRLWHECVDDVMLMAPGGRLAYLGPAKKAPAYFKKHFDLRLPRFYNPAEFLIDIIQDKADLLCNHWEKYRPSHTVPAVFSNEEEKYQKKNSRRKRGAGLKLSTMRFFLLYLRSLRQVSRDLKIHLLRFLSTAGLAIFLADRYACPAGRTLDATTVADRIALLTFSTVSMSMLSLVRSLDLVAKERPVVGRETERKLYSGLEYLFAKALVELPTDCAFAALHGVTLSWRLQQRYHAASAGAPLRVSPALPLAATAAASSTLGLAIGSLTSSADAALAVGTPLMVIHLLTGIINPSGEAASNFGSEKSRFSLHALSPIRHSVVWLITSELRGAVFKNKKKGAPQIGAISVVRTGDQVLKRLGLPPTLRPARALLLLTSIHLLLSAFGLTRSLRDSFVRILFFPYRRARGIFLGLRRRRRLREKKVNEVN